MPIAAAQFKDAAVDPWESLTALGGCSSAAPYRAAFMRRPNS